MSSDAKGIFEQTLLAREILTEEELQVARDLASEKEIRLADALIELEALTADDVAALYADAYKVRSLKLEDVEIDRETVRHVPARVAYGHQLIPVRRSGNTIVVAMADPSDGDAWKALRSVTDFEIVVFVANPDAIEHALHIYYGDAPEDIEETSRSRGAEMEGSPMIPDERFAHVGRSLPLQRRCTFDSFIEDTANQYPLSLSKSIVGGTTEENNCPVHIWGTAGSGKTHLLHAIANYLAMRDPLKKFILTTGEAFTDHLFDCLSRLKLNLFRYFYRDAKYLLLDDCDVLLEKPWAQQELAETIAAIREKDGFVVVCSRANLTADPRVAPLLKAELSKGSVAPIEEYSPEGRARVLAAQLGQISIPIDAIEKLSSSYQGDMRSLQGMLRQLAAISVLENREVTDDIIDEWLALYGNSDLAAPPKKQRKASKQMSKPKTDEQERQDAEA